MKKLFSVILTVILVASLLSSCTSSGTDEFADLSYTADSYLIDSNHISESAVRAYEALCDAVIAGDETTYFNSLLIQDVNQLFYTSFPLNALVEKIELSADGSSYEIKYKNNLEEHKKLVEEFRKKTEKIMDKCGFKKMSDKEYILNVYTYVAKNIKIDFSYTTAYDAIMSGVGSSSSFASVFEFLLQQAGINASHIYAPAADGVLFFSIAEIDGEEYLFAPYNEQDKNGGNGLSYFGMTYNDAFGLNLVDSLKHTNGNGVAPFENSNRFSSLRGTDKYTYKDGVITADKKNGEQTTVNF